jgi:hypothetical protein
LVRRCTAVLQGHTFMEGRMRETLTATSAIYVI